MRVVPLPVLSLAFCAFGAWPPTEAGRIEEIPTSLLTDPPADCLRKAAVAGNYSHAGAHGGPMTTGGQKQTMAVVIDNRACGDDGEGGNYSVAVRDSLGQLIGQYMLTATCAE